MKFKLRRSIDDAERIFYDVKAAAVIEPHQHLIRDRFSSITIAVEIERGLVRVESAITCDYLLFDAIVLEIIHQKMYAIFRVCFVHFAVLDRVRIV